MPSGDKRKRPSHWPLLFATVFVFGWRQFITTSEPSGIFKMTSLE